jgi:hypothetical protein
LAVPIGEPFEEPFLVLDRTLFTEGSTWNQKGFYLKPKRVLLWEQLKNPFGTLFAKGV